MPKPYQPKVGKRWVTVGVVLRPFGIKGELKVRLETDFPERFQPGARLYYWVPPKPEPEEPDAFAPRSKRRRPPRTTQPKECFIESVRWHGEALLIKLKGIDTLNDAEPLHGAWLVIPPEERMPLAEDEYYIDDLIGLEAFTEEGKRVGVLKRVIPGSVYDFYEIGKHVLPAVDEYILQIDLANRKIIVRLPELE
ncbi:MAG: ribosome maturation factor RimM [Fimbriimonadales bacterium]